MPMYSKGPYKKVSNKKIGGTVRKMGGGMAMKTKYKSKGGTVKRKRGGRTR